jgi:glutathione S-transferase
MTRPLTIVGSFVSPYVRKVLACMNLKRLSFEVDPITPFFGSDKFERLSPLRRIPVLIDGELSVSDSTVICEYLDETYPGHPLLPGNPNDRARARWFEEYADTRLGDIFIWGLFYQKIVHPLVWGEPGDQARIERTLNEDAPAALDYLERELPADGFLFGDIGLADIAIASFFRNAAYAGFEPDASSEPWPIPASPTFSSSRTSSAMPRSRAAARPCSTPGRRSLPRPSACASRARGTCAFSGGGWRSSARAGSAATASTG